VKIGDFSRGGKNRVLREAADHDFQAEATLAPPGILLPRYDDPSLYFTPSRVSSDFIVEVLDGWWEPNRARFGQVGTRVINQDNGPENKSRRMPFLLRMVGFARKRRLLVRRAYHSKYNLIELCRHVRVGVIQFRGRGRRATRWLRSPLQQPVQRTSRRRKPLILTPQEEEAERCGRMGASHKFLPDYSPSIEPGRGVWVPPRTGVRVSWRFGGTGHFGVAGRGSGMPPVVGAHVLTSNEALHFGHVAGTTIGWGFAECFFGRAINCRGGV
jgi:hypothetical protein